FHDIVHWERVNFLVALVQDRKFVLRSMGDGDFRQKKTERVNVTYPGKKDVVLSFDKATGHLILSECRIEKQVEVAQSFEDIRAVDWLGADEKLMRQAHVNAEDARALA